MRGGGDITFEKSLSCNISYCGPMCLVTERCVSGVREGGGGDAEGVNKGGGLNKKVLYSEGKYEQTRKNKWWKPFSGTLIENPRH